jgi:PAS domain S-box-containing protein
MPLDAAAATTILVVDPDPDTCELYSEWFGVGGFSVVAATDADAALRLFEQHHPAAVVTEIRLQPLDGIELVARLKSMAGGQRVPVVVVTSQADARSMMRALVAGAVEAIAKPCDFQRLCAVVAGAVASTRPGQRGRGRPAAGLKGQRTSDYPQLSVRLPPETRAALYALAAAQRRPMWRVLMDALAAWERREMGRELRSAIDEIRCRSRQSERPEIMRGVPDIVSDCDRTSVAVLAADNAARYVAVNDAAVRLTGFAREELLALSIWDLTAPGHVTEGRAAWQRFLNEGEFDGVYRLKRKDGTLIWVHSIAVAHLVRGFHVSALAEVSDAAIVAA